MIPWQELLITNTPASSNAFGPRDAGTRLLFTRFLTRCNHDLPLARRGGNTREISMMAVSASPKSHMSVGESANSRQQTGRGGGQEGNIGALRPSLLHYASVLNLRDFSSTTLEVRSCIRACKAKSRTRSIINDATKQLSSLTPRISSYDSAFVLQRTRKISTEKLQAEEVRGYTSMEAL